MTITPRSSAFAIFRGKDALELGESKCMTPLPFTPVQMEGVKKLVAAGYRQGSESQVLCSLPGFSLVYSWFKKDYPLMLHSHNSDCLYYVIAGSLHLGTEELGPKDSVFVPADVPYTFRAGVDGVEFLEFRHETHFDFVNKAKSEAFYDKAEDIIRANAVDWQNAVPPSKKVLATAAG